MTDPPSSTEHAFHPVAAAPRGAVVDPTLPIPRRTPRKKEAVQTSTASAASWKNALFFLLGASVAYSTVAVTWAGGSSSLRTPDVIPTSFLTAPSATLLPRNFTKIHLVVAHYKEDLSWLHKGWGAKYTHTIYEMGRWLGPADFSVGFTHPLRGDGSQHYLTNWGDESSGYLRFIIDHYDNLPDITVFVHGSPAEHNRKIGDWVGCLRRDTWFTFLTTGWVEDRCIVDLKNRSLIPKFDYNAFVDFWLRFPWTELGVGSLPRCLSFYCCAEFAISRAAIRARPLHFYKRMWSFTLDYVLNQNVARKYKGWSLRQIGGIFEHVWHVMFGESMTMAPYHDPCHYFTCGPCKAGKGRSEQRKKPMGITVTEAWLGGNCPEPPPAKNVSRVLRFVKENCDGKYQCTVTPRGTFADPCPSPDFHVAWQCDKDLQSDRARTLSTRSAREDLRITCPGPTSADSCPKVEGAPSCKHAGRGCKYHVTKQQTCSDFCGDLVMACLEGQEARGECDTLPSAPRSCSSSAAPQTCLCTS